MIFYVLSGELEYVVNAPTAKEAASKAVRSFRGSLAQLIMVNEGADNTEVGDDSVFFLTQHIVDECSMRLVS